jgi:hypothetical protein
MRDIGHRLTRPRLVVVAKIDTPPGPTKNPTTIRTMPRSTCPWKSWTIPAITRTTAIIHKMVAMARCYPAADARILVAAPPVAVATPYRHGAGAAERRARQWGRFLRQPAHGRGESPKRLYLVGCPLRRRANVATTTIQPTGLTSTISSSRPTRGEPLHRPSVRRASRIRARSSGIAAITSINASGGPITYVETDPRESTRGTSRRIHRRGDVEFVGASDLSGWSGVRVSQSRHRRPGRSRFRIDLLTATRRVP